MTGPSPFSYFLVSLGCSKNQVDSEKINGALKSEGFVPVEVLEEANIIIINTCGFIQPAKEESIDLILEAAQHKEDRFLAVVGCLSQRYMNELKADIPEIDLVYGLADSGFISTLFSALGYKANDKDFHLIQEPLSPGNAYSYIKIAEGCSNNCSFCAIPLIRGPLRSFPVEDILNDARQAISKGARELVIVAQDIASWSYGTDKLSDLVNMISVLEGVKWIRLMYCHPDHISSDIISLLKNNPAVVPYIDLPFQHASERILRSMGRKGSSAHYEELIASLRNEIPDICIRSTFLIGYPGETEEEFEQLLEFAEKVRLDRVGAFTFFPEEGTSAFELDGMVPQEIMDERLDRFMKLQQRISEERLARMRGKVVPVLIEEQIDEKTYMGRTVYDAPEVDGIFYLTGCGVKINEIIDARVTGSFEYDLYGELS